jgi:hypothetical protein
MTQYNLNDIQANSSNDLVSKIGKERIKKCKSPDCSKLLKVEVPSLRLCYYCKNKTSVAKRIKAIREEHPDREIVVK